MSDSNLSVNFSLNDSLWNNDYSIFVPKVTITLVVCYIMGLWTIILHGLLMFCFYLNRNAVWIQKAKGILSLIYTDFLAGIGFLLLISTQTRLQVGRYACILPLGNYMTTQLLTSLQILRICIYRLTVVLTNNKHKHESTRATILQFVVLFTVSAGVNSIPVIWVQWEDYYLFCTLEFLVGEHMRKACIFMLLVFTVPNIATSCIYILIIYLLKTRSGTVRPVIELSNVTSLRHEFSEGNSSAQERRQNLTDEDRMKTNMERKTTNLAMRKYWKKAVVTVGIVLLLNNIALLPYVLILSYQIAFGAGKEIPAFLWFGSGLFLLTNSALSPFVYCFRIKAIKMAFMKMLHKIFCR